MCVRGLGGEGKEEWFIIVKLLSDECMEAVNWRL